MRQNQIETITKKFIQVLLAPKWFQTNDTEHLAKDYFKDFKFDEKALFTIQDSDFIINVDKTTKEYLAYVMMDFCMVDEEGTVALI